MKKPAPPKTVTLLDVARAANVSKTTVSNVFARPERVRAELRERVVAAAASLDYDGPDPKARLLNSGKVGAIGVVPPATGMTWVFANRYMSDFLTGVGEVCEPRGVGISLVYDDGGSGTWGVKSAVVDGFILSNIRQAALIEPARRRKLPFVVMDVDGGRDVRSVRIDDRGMARDMARHLLALGHRRIGVLSCGRETIAPVFHAGKGSPRRMVMSFSSDDDRIAGIGDALAEAGLAIDDMPIVEGCGNAEEAARFGGAAALLLDRAPDITAVIATSVDLGQSTLIEARRRGIDVPGQLSVISVDNSPESALTDPPLTVAAEPAREKGYSAAELLFETGPARQVVLPTPLIVRESTAPPPDFAARGKKKRTR